MVTPKRELRADIVALFDAAERDGCGAILTQEQLRELIRFEAEELGLTFAEAVERGRRRTLPKNLAGMDIEMLVLMLEDDTIGHSPQRFAPPEGDPNMTTTTRELPESIAKAFEEGVLTKEQVREVIGWDAEQLGLTYDEAVERARNRTLPINMYASDIRMLLMLLDAADE